MRIHFIASTALFLFSRVADATASARRIRELPGMYSPYLLDRHDPLGDAVIADCVSEMQQDILEQVSELRYSTHEFESMKKKCVRIAESKSSRIQTDIRKHMRALSYAAQNHLEPVSRRFDITLKSAIRAAVVHLTADPTNLDWTKPIVKKVIEISNDHLDQAERDYAGRDVPLMRELFERLRPMANGLSAFDEITVDNIEDSQLFIDLFQRMKSDFDETQYYKDMLRDIPELNKNFEAARQLHEQVSEQIVAEFDSTFAVSG